MEIDILSTADKFPGQGVCSATQDHIYLLEKYSDYDIYIKTFFLENMISYMFIQLIQRAFFLYYFIKRILLAL